MENPLMMKTDRAVINRKNLHFEKRKQKPTARSKPIKKEVK